MVPTYDLSAPGGTYKQKQPRSVHTLHWSLLLACSYQSSDTEATRLASKSHAARLDDATRAAQTLPAFRVPPTPRPGQQCAGQARGVALPVWQLPLGLPSALQEAERTAYFQRSAH